MFIEKIIHTYWAGQPELLSILKAEQVLTGPTFVPGLPMLVLECASIKPLRRTNRSHGWEEAVVTFELFEAQLLLERVDAHFNRLRFTDESSGLALRFRRGERRSVRYDNQRWGCVVHYTVEVREK